MKLLIIFFALIVLSLCDEIQDRDARGLFDCLLNCPKGNFIKILSINLNKINCFLNREKTRA